MSGDDSIIERSRILKKIERETGAVILVATQVIEAGVDIDMDIAIKISQNWTVKNSLWEGSTARA